MADERINVEIVVENKIAEELVTIPRKEYESLKEDSDWLQCLQSAGVDNWSGYDYARELQREGE